MSELYKKHRPNSFKSLAGQSTVKKVLSKMVKQNKVPHTILFHGPGGTGKTTLARILAKKLKCSKHDFYEVNCADFRGIDMVRSIKAKYNQGAMEGSVRIWLIDEAHRLTKEAQDAFLKMLEDTPEHVYFILATTEPNKLSKTIRDRATKFALSSIPEKCMKDLVKEVAKKEKIKISDDVLEELVDGADGSARSALVMLEKISFIEDEEERIKICGEGLDADTVSFDLAKMLGSERPNWTKIADILSKLKEEPETTRHIVLGYGRSMMLACGQGKSRGYAIVTAFCDDFFQSGKAGLCAACFEICHD